MNDINVSELKFEEIEITESKEDAFILYFTIDEARYFTKILSGEVRFIRHVPSKKTCGICKTNHSFGRCWKLEEHKEEFYEVISKHPNVRLRILLNSE